MSESMAKIRQIRLYCESWSMDHGTVELPWNFFFDLETAIYKTYLDQTIKSSTVPSLFLPLNKKINLV